MLVTARRVRKYLRTAIAALAIRGLVTAAIVGWVSLYPLAKAYADDVLKLTTDVWLPYENISNVAAPGFSTEIISSVLADMGVGITIREAPWARGLNDVFEGRTDALFTAFWTEERAAYCFYPDESLATEKWVFFVRSEVADELAFSSYDQIRNRRIGILRGASVSEEFWSFLREHAIYEEVGTDDLNFKKLNKGRLDYVVTSYSNGTMLLREMALTGFIRPLPSPVIKEDDLFIIFSKKTVEPEFVERFSTALKKFKTTASYQAIFEKYFGAQGP